MLNVETDLNQLKKLSLYRTLENVPGIDFTSNDYLQLCHDPEHVEVFHEILRFQARATGSGSARLLNGTHPLHTQCEEEFAYWQGYEAGLLFSSGYLANCGVIPAVAGVGDIIYSDTANHASIIDGIRLSKAERRIFHHLDLGHLQELLWADRQHGGRKLIITESVFSMDGDGPSLHDYYELAESYGAALMVDEAHAVGLFGPNYQGRIAEAGLSGKVDIAVFPCGKAIAASGAVVCCSEQVRQYLINHSRAFIFSTAPQPAQAAAILAFLTRLAQIGRRSEQLSRMVKYLRNESPAFSTMEKMGDWHIVPLLIGKAEAALQISVALQQAGFSLRAIRPPTVPPGTARLRLSLNSSITPKVIENLGRALIQLCQMHPVSLLLEPIPTLAKPS